MTHNLRSETAKQCEIIVGRYEELRAAVLGEKLAVPWGRTVALRKGLTCWIRLMLCDFEKNVDGTEFKSRISRGSEEAPVYLEEIATVVAEMLVSKLCLEKIQ